MKYIRKVLIILVCIFLIFGCKSNKKEYDAYINGTGYNLNEDINIDVKFKTKDTNIKVCPIIEITKDGEEDASKISNYINFSTDKVEFLSLLAENFSEKYNEGIWSFETKMVSLGNDDFSFDDTIIKLKVNIKEKGSYNIKIKENATECGTKYIDNLSLDIGQ